MKPRAIVSDHALLRYMERALGLDVEALRVEVARIVEVGIEHGASGVQLDGCSYKLIGDRVTTVLFTGRPDIRLGRKARKSRPVAEDATGDRGPE